MISLNVVIYFCGISQSFTISTVCPMYNTKCFFKIYTTDIHRLLRFTTPLNNVMHSQHLFDAWPSTAEACLFLMQPSKFWNLMLKSVQFSQNFSHTRRGHKGTAPEKYLKFNRAFWKAEGNPFSSSKYVQ